MTQIAEIKHHFMAYRNGILADTLRQAGWPHKVIFGLNVPQLNDIATTLQKPDLQLALQLWADREVRESRLLAPYLLPSDMDQDDILAITSDIRTPEEADMLAFRWLRHHPNAMQISQLSTLHPLAKKSLSRFLQPS